MLSRVGQKGSDPLDTVFSILADSDHRMWVGTENGLIRLQETQIALIPVLGASTVYGAISGGLNGDIEMVVQQAFRISNGKAIPIFYPGLRDATVLNTYHASDGSTWIGAAGRGVYHLDHGLSTHYTMTSAQPITSNFTRGFFESSSGEMWIATFLGLNRVTRTGVIRYGVADGLASVGIRSLCEDNEHDIWVGTDLDLSRWRNGRFVEDAATRGLRDKRVWSVMQDRSGAMWFGTRDQGLFRYRNGKLKQYTTAQGLLSNIVYQVLKDRTGRFWISSTESISSIPESQMDAESNLYGRPMSATEYRMPSEAEGVQLSGGRISTAYLAPDDTTWFASHRGALHVAATERTSTEKPPVAVISGLTIDGVSKPFWDGLRVPARVSRISFSLAPLFLGPQERIRSVYSLEGFDPDWIPAGNVHTATYTNLPAGRYRFRMRTFDASHAEIFTEADLSFSKAPLIYQTWWFRLLCVVVAVGLGFVLYMMHFRRVRSRFAAVLEEHGRLAREMHDTVIQGCTGVSLLLEVMATQRESEHADDELLNFARAQLEETIGEACGAMWNLRRNGGDNINLHSSLEALADQATQALGIPVTLVCPDKARIVEASVGHELLMVTREALANAGCHACATTILISAASDLTGLTMSVKDDGSGFEPSSLPTRAEGHYGLIGMQERMERIGGSLSIRSNIGDGTEIMMSLKQNA